MSNRGSRPKRGRQHSCFRHFRARGTGSFRGARMHVEAIGTLCRTRYRDRNQFAILSRDGSVFAPNNLVESDKTRKTRRRKFFKLAQYFQILRIVIVHIPTPRERILNHAVCLHKRKLARATARHKA